MQFYKSNDTKSLIQKLHEKPKQKNQIKQNLLWILFISLASFILSLVLSLFSEVFLSSSSIFLAVLVLIAFMGLNVISDMFGLAITSCQVTKIKKLHINQKEKIICIYLIKNSDKVSSILCDVIGDACGILCGAGVSVLSIILSNIVGASSILFGVIVSSVVVCLTVLIKAITKNYAINNSLKILRLCSKIILRLKKK